MESSERDVGGGQQSAEVGQGVRGLTGGALGEVLCHKGNPSMQGPPPILLLLSVLPWWSTLLLLLLQDPLVLRVELGQMTGKT